MHEHKLGLNGKAFRVLSIVLGIFVSGAHGCAKNPAAEDTAADATSAPDTTTEQFEFPCIPECPDGGPCATIECVQGECITTLTPDEPCDDGDACTSEDRCTSSGVCVGPVMQECDDDNPCTTDGCADGKCIFIVANDQPCEDDDVCTEDDRCTEEGACAGTPRDCPDDGVCTALCASRKWDAISRCWTE